MLTHPSVDGELFHPWRRSNCRCSGCIEANLQQVTHQKFTKMNLGWQAIETQVENWSLGGV